MSAPNPRIRIATRKSPLALWQANHVGDELRRLVVDLEVDLVQRTTKGDRILDQSLSKIGGKDLFVKEIENALLEGQAEVAVHSLKDVPTVLPDGLHIAAFPARGDSRDALVSPQGYTLQTLPAGATVGTSSLRRGALLRASRPDLEIVQIRGNVQTRLAKLRSENMAATVLALVGLERLEMESIVSEVLEPDVCLPAIGQGILAVETRADDVQTNALVSRLDDRATRMAAIAERAFLARLEGGCQIPIAGHATVDGDTLRLRGLVAEVRGQRVVRGERSGSGADAKAIGEGLADELIDRGAGSILDELKES